MRIVYVIGFPGSGKTTLLDKATAGWSYLLHRRPFSHMEYDPHDGQRIVQLGEPRPPFSGTDTLSMAVMPKVLAWLESADCDVVVGEGDRLTSEAFFEACDRRGALTVVNCYTPPEEARKRSMARGTQDLTWWKGRVTKVDNILGKRGHIRLHGYGDGDHNAALLRNIILKGVPA